MELENFRRIDDFNYNHKKYPKYKLYFNEITKKYAIGIKSFETYKLAQYTIFFDSFYIDAIFKNKERAEKIFKKLVEANEKQENKAKRLQDIQEAWKSSKRK